MASDNGSDAVALLALSDAVALLALCLSGLSLVVSFMSWRSAVQSTKATIYERRYEVYADTERFISAWMRAGTPDLSMLPDLVGAWSRSHFLFDKDVTDYLRKLWTDAVQANYLNKIIRGDIPGDHGKAVDKDHELLKFHCDYDKLRDVMMKKLRVE